jgi:hypothetical protein
MAQLRPLSKANMMPLARMHFHLVQGTGKKSTKANLAREASALALSEALKAMLTDF